MGGNTELSLELKCWYRCHQSLRLYGGNIHTSHVQSAFSRR